MPLEVAQTIAVGQMPHHFEYQQVSPIHNVPSAASSESLYQFLKHLDMQLKRPLCRYARHCQ